MRLISPGVEPSMDRFDTLGSRCVREGFSDVHATDSYPAIYRKNRMLEFDKGVKWSHGEADPLVSEIVNSLQLSILWKRRSIGFGSTIYALLEPLGRENHGN
jgi:hypothetical protein